MRWFIAALVFCLLNIPVRAENCVASVCHGRIVATWNKNRDRHTAQRQRLDGGAQIAALWFQSKGHQQEEWPCRHGHDHGPRALCEEYPGTTIRRGTVSYRCRAFSLRCCTACRPTTAPPPMVPRVAYPMPRMTLRPRSALTLRRRSSTTKCRFGRGSGLAIK
jgi:hypothetical protein